VVDGKAAQTQVKVGEYVNGKVEVLEGLQAGELVVTAGQLKIADGMGVAPIPNAAAPAEPAAGGDSGGSSGGDAGAASGGG